MNTLIIGFGEVGRAHAEVLSKVYQVWIKDIGPLQSFEKDGTLKEANEDQEFDIAHICLDYHGLGNSKWLDIVNGYNDKFKPSILDICSTVRPGTTRLLGSRAVHSTTRGLHPNLSAGLRSIVKHVGGLEATAVARYFERAGIRCIAHKKPETTELAHILNNSAYGVSLMFADEMSRLCREYGVDYYEAVMRYTATHNQGFRALDHDRLVRPILTPPYGRIGGHCVQQGAELIPEELRGPLLERLANYNNQNNKAIMTEKNDPEIQQEAEEAVNGE